MSILTTAVNNITVLVSHNVIFFGCSMHMSHGVNKTPPSASPYLISHYQVFTKFVCCCEKKTLSTSFCSDQVIAKNNAFSKHKKIYSFKYWNTFKFCLILILILASVLLTCVFYGVFLFTVLPPRNKESIISHLHGFRFGLSSNHVTWEKNYSFNITKCRFFCYRGN